MLWHLVRAGWTEEEDQVVVTGKGGFGRGEAERHLVLDLTKAEWDEGYQKFSSGVFVQYAFPTLSNEEREFLISGTTPEEWREMFSDPEE